MLINLSFFITLFFMTETLSDKCITPKSITIFGDPYILRTHFVSEEFKIPPPETIILNNNEIFSNAYGHTYTLKRNMVYEKSKNRIPMKYMTAYACSSGEEIVIENGKPKLYMEMRTIEVNLNIKNYVARNMAVDTKNDRIFFLCFPPKNKARPTNKIYVYERSKLQINNNKMDLYEVPNLGFNVTAITMDRKKGDLIMSIINIKNNQEYWSFQILEKVPNVKKITVDTGFNKNALESATMRAGHEIVRLYEEAMKNGGKIDTNLFDEAIVCSEELKNSEARVAMLMAEVTTIRMQISKFNSTIDSMKNLKTIKDVLTKSVSDLYQTLDILVNIFKNDSDSYFEIETGTEIEVDIRFKKEKE